MNGPWSEWQTAKVDVSKPSVSSLDAGPGTEGDGLWTLSSLEPWFEAKVTDPDGRNVGLSVEVEHDPSAAGQGTGRIWSYGTGVSDPSGSYVWAEMPSDELKDGWLIRWRVRGSVMTADHGSLYGAWSLWQTAKVDISKPTVTFPNAGPGTNQGAGLWTLSSPRPWFEAKVTDPEGRNVGLDVQVEHDPSVPAQGTGRIWSYGTGWTGTSGTTVQTAQSDPLTDGWLIRWRVRGTTYTTGSATVNGPWSGWQTARVDISKPSVTSLRATPGTYQGGGLTVISSPTPAFEAKVTDPDGRKVGLSVEVEHDPSVPAQGTGRIWSYGTGWTGTSGTTVQTAQSDPLTDGWLIRWRVRGTTYTGSSTAVNGPWSEWQTARIEVSRPAVTSLRATPGTYQGGGLTVISSPTPAFEAKVTDPDGRKVGLSVQVEHDPSVPAQGTGYIWSYGTGWTGTSGTTVQTAQSDPLTDGWLIRWRVRGTTYTGSATAVNGPWSEWQTARVSINNPAGTGLGVLPGMQAAGAWTLSSLTPWLYTKVTSSGGASSYLGVEMEHDPSVPDQGSGQIWAGQGTTSYPSGTNAWAQVPTTKLSDGWLIRWRVRGVTTTGTNGPWSDWQTARVDLKKPSVTALGVTPGTISAGLSRTVSLTPWIYGKVTDPENRASYLSVEMEHDPSVPDQGSGQIWAGQGTTSYPSGTNAWAQVPTAKLSDGWLIRWRVRGVTTTGTNGPWSDWQTARVDLNEPAVEGVGMNPATRGSVSWTSASLVPWLYAKVTDPQGRASYLDVEMEHDPSVPDQGSGQIWAGQGTTSYPSGTNAWVQVPSGKLFEGWKIRWRVRGVTTTAVNGPWSDWQFATVAGLPFTVFSPDNNMQVGTLTPTLSTHAQPMNEAPVTYWFQVCAGTKPNWTWCESSPEWTKSGAWKVPEQKLKWGETYWWYAKAATSSATVTSAWRAFTPVPEQGTLSSLLTSGTEGREFNHASGNYTHTETDLAVAVAGPPLTVARTYNSLDPRTDGAFGSGWTTRWDMRIDNEPQTATLLVTYPDGEQLRFAAKGDGTYAAPLGTYATLAVLPEGGWRLMDKSAASYWFDSSGRLTKITDHRSRTQELTYGTDGKLAKATATGGRSLTFTWSGGHIASVSTDPVNGTPITWNYTYDGDKLTKVCPPATGGACTVYTYGDASRYSSLVLDAAPVGYWRLNETATALGTKIPSATAWKTETDDAKLAGVLPDATAATPGALTGSPNTAIRFKGTVNSAYVSVPSTMISGQGNSLAVEAWFKTTGSGTVIGYQNSATDVPSAFTPVVYVGKDGKLRGQFYNGKPTPITSATPVNNGAWHHVVLSGAENTQTLFLDGQAVGTLSGTIMHVDQWETRIGYGYGSPSWPSTTSSTAAFPFAGDIDEVAVYGKPLGAQVVKAHYAARLPQPQVTKVVAPSGRTVAENVYAADGGRLTTHTDNNGGAWTLSSPVYAKESSTLTSATVTVTDPHSGTLTYVSDSLHGNRAVSQTDQLGKTTKYTYDTGGFPAKVIDPNGNAIEMAYNVRGNLLAKKTCRTAGSCSSEYFTYRLDVDNPFDPRNDLRVAHRDARSASPTDETYQTSWTFNAFGEETKQTTPVTPDFPQGRSTTNVYTDGTEPAIGGGLTPAGLLKSAKDFKGNETTYAYTAAGDRATETSPTGLVKKYEHDALGRVSKETVVSSAYPDGVATAIVYDALGRVVSRTDSGVKNDVTGVTHTAQTTHTYDADGLPLTESQADLTGGDPQRTTTYTYDSYGRVETVTAPEGGVQRFAYNHKGQKVSFTDERGTTYTYGYTTRGELAETTLKGWTGSPLSPQPATDVVMLSSAYDPAGRLASQTDVMGRTTAYTYYTDNLLFERIAKGVKLNGSATARDVVQDSLVYDAAGNPIRKTSGNGTLRVDAVYDAAGRVTSQATDPAGRNVVTTAGYDANNNVTKVTQTAAGTDRTEISEYAYNADNQPIRQVTRNGDEDLITTLTVDDRGLVTAMTDARGNAPGADPAAFTSNMTYNAAGLATQVQLPTVTVERPGTAPAGQRPTTKLGYNTFGEQTQQVDAEGRTTTTTLDKAGRPVEQTFPAYTPPGGQPITPRTTGAYDAAGQLISAVDRRGQTTTAVYDALGRKVQVTAPKVGTAAAGVWTYGYDLLGEALWTTDPTGARSESTYDDLGRQITLTTVERKPTQAAYVTKLEYDDADRLVKSTRPTGESSTRAYDATGALIGQTDPLGNTTTFGYDLAGRPVKTTNPLGVSSTASYDLAGRRIQTQELNAAGTVLRTEKVDYDPAGNPISQTSAEGHITTRIFDAANRLVELREPVSATKKIISTFGYDASGARTRSTDGRGNATFTTYNSLGLIESVIEPSTAAHPNLSDRTWTTGYDAGGNPVATAVPGGVRIDRTFDELNRLVKQVGSGAEAATEDKVFGYDLAGRLTSANDLSFTLNDRGLLLKTAGTGGDISAYAYDANQRLTQRVDATGTSAFTWDNADRLTQSVDPVSATTIDYAYDQASRLTGMTYGAGGARRSYTYDPLNRLTKDELTTSANGPIASIEYGYDLDDNLTTKTTAGTAGAGTNTYTYDWSNRLTSWTAPGGAKTDYEWDDSGNRTRAGTKTYTYDERNRLTSGDGYTYTYTARGTLAEQTNGQVHLSKFDAFDRLINDDAVQYDYDALDRVETRTQGQQAAHFTYDGLTNQLVTVTDANNVRKAAFGRDALGRTLGINDGTGAQLAFSDLHGDLIGVFTATGTSLIDSTAYDPFGEVITRTGNAHTLGYQGGYTDPSTGKVNMAARWYQPTTGSFVSRDTLTQNPDPSVQLNRYVYANDNPLTNIDPDGHAARATTKKKSKTKTKTSSIKPGKSIKCPKGTKKGNNSICSDAAGEYRECKGEKYSNGVCQDMKDDYVGCRTEKRAGNSKSNADICSDFADQYLVCRKGSDYQSKKSDDVCSGAGREVRRCQYGELDSSKRGYGESTGACGNVRFDYYSCRADKRGDDQGCSSFSEVKYKCSLHRDVRCDDLEDKFLSCYKKGRGGSANECAFGANMLAHCRDSMNRGFFDKKSTCGDAWNTFLKECQGSRGSYGEKCTKGESWQDVTYSICEKRAQGHGCVSYVSGQDIGKVQQGGGLTMVFVFAGLDVCTAVGGAVPQVAGVCGVAKIIGSTIEEIRKDVISSAIAGSAEHAEEGGLQMSTTTSNCVAKNPSKYTSSGQDCSPKNEHVVRTQYAPL
ncbi:RHS repeat-associated core domain-containing protein [Streptosporangium sp. NPDC049376]|uniref:RHS repeat-associated core domain-containing protein n=1 Tax=Streptosporangium sp. NPDC049376 TaxID=3366192 RepID=UPI00379AF41A